MLPHGTVTRSEESSEPVQHEVLLFTKAIKVNRRLDCLYLVSGQLRNHWFEALEAYPLRMDLAVSLESKSPLEVLRTFANRFGIDIEFGSKKQKFLMLEKVKVQKSDGPQQIIRWTTRPKELIGSTYLRLLETKSGRFAEVALAYGIDLAKYKEWLTSTRSTK
jgi:hypothetical protein